MLGGFIRGIRVAVARGRARTATVLYNATMVDLKSSTLRSALQHMRDFTAGYYLHTLYLFTKSDMKTILLPIVSRSSLP